MTMKFQLLRHQASGIAAATAVALAPAPALAQAQRQPSGIYLDVPGKTGDEALVKLDVNVLQPKQKGMLTTTLTGGLVKSEMVGVMDEPAAELRVATGDISFQFVFSTQKPGKAPTVEEAMSMGGGYDSSGIPSNAKTPKDFGLLPLEVKDTERHAGLGKAGGMMGKASKPDNLVPLTVTEIAPGVYRVKPKDPLPPGEYVFYITAQGGGQVWDFGVDKK